MPFPGPEQMAAGGGHGHGATNGGNVSQPGYPAYAQSTTSSNTTAYSQVHTTTLDRRPTTLGRAPTRRLAPGANNIANASHNIQRGRTLIRPDRYQEPAPLLTGKPTTSQHWFDPWVILSRIVTFWAVVPMLRALGKHDPGMQQAWREKITLCFLITCIGGFVAFITIGLSAIMCPPDQSNNQQMYASYNDTINSAGLLGILGWQFNISSAKSPKSVDLTSLAQVPGTDITMYFDRSDLTPACDSISDSTAQKFSAVTFDPCSSDNGYDGCPLGQVSASTFKKLGIVNTTRLVGYDWDQLVSPNLTNFLVIDGNMLDLDPYIKANPNPISNDTLDNVIRTVLNQTFAQGGRDATMLLSRHTELRAAVDCLVQKYRAGNLDKTTAGCVIASIILYCALCIVISIVLARFLMALLFSWFFSSRMSRSPRFDEDNTTDHKYSEKPAMEMSNMSKRHTLDPMARMDSATTLQGGRSTPTSQVMTADLYTVVLITCYSENTEGIRATVESLSSTDYPDDRKLLFLVADGIIVGSGEKISTPDMCLSLVTFDNPAMRTAEPKSYIAVANGSKQHNRAKVYAGHYKCKNHKVPMILVVKCGNPEEEGKPKAGNRGKRDSQLILMNFFSRVTYNDRMTPLDYELFTKIHYLMGVTPDMFELVLMVDADTKVYNTSLRLLVNCMVNDNLIMGLCGETKIANKRGSWVTAIQVYEYFISHHLAKGFESIFGGVTCLPGCFCMYRLKARKGDGDWVPIITKPEIVQEYSQNTVDTLHQKNLLLLGEDRFLTTLMLRTFPYRKMVFTPDAVCKTIVPDEFKVLLSQRRRWINSTIHNLFELILVRNLCGTFCFSMQFVVLMDLVGTLTLPVAIVLTFVLIINVARTSITSFTTAVPLVLLIIVLFSPAFLILITTRKWVYLAWMGVYLCALPIWNFVLPVYSFWHFDDFSWGETRKVTGEAKGDDHGKKDGVFDPSVVPLRRWDEYERKRIRAQKRRERQMRDLGPMYHPQDIVHHEQNQAQPPPPPQGAQSPPLQNAAYPYSQRPPVSSPSEPQQPMHYYNPVSETPGRATSGYYPAYRPQAAAQPVPPLPRGNSIGLAQPRPAHPPMRPYSPRPMHDPRMRQPPSSPRPVFVPGNNGYMIPAPLPKHGDSSPGPRPRPPPGSPHRPT